MEEEEDKEACENAPEHFLKKKMSERSLRWTDYLQNATQYPVLVSILKRIFSYYGGFLEDLDWYHVVGWLFGLNFSSWEQSFHQLLCVWLKFPSMSSSPVCSPVGQYHSDVTLIL